HLATHLEPGKPCPVCGSPEHPAPAAGTAEDAELAARYRQAKAAFEEQNMIAEKAAIARTETTSLLRQREGALAELAVPEGSAAEIGKLVAAAQRDIEALGPQRDIDECSVQVARAAEAMKVAKAELETVRNDRDRVKLDANSAKTEFDSALATIPEELRALDQLEAAIEAAQNEIATYERAFTEAVQEGQTAAGDLASATTAFEIAGRDIESATEQMSKEKELFDAGLSRCGLTQETFNAARADIDRIDEIDGRIRSFGERLAAATDRLARAKAAIAETDRPDIAARKVARDDAEVAYKQLYEEAARTAQRLEHLKKLHREIQAEVKALDQLESETGPLRDLAQAFSGDNDARTTLEAFAIATMFDHVLAAANLRLEPMTSGRFRLARGGDGHGRARRGLDIQVEDSFTGRARQTSTLSGGETFIAALALALGLSDVVESTRGNVRLDAIFIDEGFGSLDSADDAGTLDQVLQSLIELVGKRRAVGLISHVPLVQQTVPNGFWVKASPRGSYIEERS
ncbi:MAG: SbcC/MukB-like Walker B domain-containing protein, partial [Hyphomicrobiaceae bacterium]